MYDFSRQIALISEAWAIENNIPIRRRFTHEELEESITRVREAVALQQPLEVDVDPDPDNFDYDPDYARQDAEARGEPTDYRRDS